VTFYSGAAVGVCIGDGQALEYRIGAFSGIELEPTVRMELASLAINDTGLRVATLGPHGDPLAQEIEVSVPSADKGTVGQ
jgi:hypothetical protein